MDKISLQSVYYIIKITLIVKSVKDPNVVREIQYVTKMRIIINFYSRKNVKNDS